MNENYSINKGISLTNSETGANLCAVKVSTAENLLAKLGAVHEQQHAMLRDLSDRIGFVLSPPAPESDSSGEGSPGYASTLNNRLQDALVDAQRVSRFITSIIERVSI